MNKQKEEPKFEKVVEYKGLGLLIVGLYNLFVGFILYSYDYESTLILLSALSGLIGLFCIAFHFSPENRKVYWRRIK